MIILLTFTSKLPLQFLKIILKLEYLPEVAGAAAKLKAITKQRSKFEIRVRTERETF